MATLINRYMVDEETAVARVDKMVDIEVKK